MAVSAPDSAFQVPGFRDRLGDRVIVPQPSGALLEYLYFCDALAAEPFFIQALKDRVARLSAFTYSSYCRVRRVQQAVEWNSRPALVSAHVAGRRLAEILEVASRADVRPPTSGVLAVARQMMASVALLHDFAPDGFHGAIGPDRLILAGEGRVVIAEHVLGTVVGLAAEAWGVARLWQELRIAAITTLSSAQDGRRNDVVQVGLVVLALLAGRSLRADDYPEQVGRLLDEATETGLDGAPAPLGSGLREWLERTLSLAGEDSYSTLLDAQKAFSRLLQDPRCGASSAVWEAFVSVCETAALRVVVPTASALDQPAEAATGPAAAAGAEQPSWAPIDPGAGADEDPFGQLPVAVAEESAATLLAAFPAAGTPTVPAESPRPVPDVLPAVDDAPVASPATRAHVETLFAAPDGRPLPVNTDTRPAALPPVTDSGGPVASASRRAHEAAKPAMDGAFLSVAAQEGMRPNRLANRPFGGVKSRRGRTERTGRRLLLLAVLAVAAVLVAVYAPGFWAFVFEGRRGFGRVTIESDVAGAAVTVDGQARGQTPTVVMLPIGRHQLEVRGLGSVRLRTIVVADREKRTERLTLDSSGDLGGLEISTYPAAGRISIDGVPRGRAPVSVTDLAPGVHTMTVETSLGAQEQDVIVQAGAVLRLAVSTVSWVKVVAPYELRVSENGRILGTTGSGAVTVAPGRRHLEFSNPALGLRLRQLVDAMPGQLTVVPLELPSGTLSLSSDQPAEVYVDGRKVGETPLLSLAVALGFHEVEFRHPRYGQLRYTVSATLAGPVRLSASFRR